MGWSARVLGPPSGRKREVRMLGRQVGAADAGEVQQLARARSGCGEPSQGLIFVAGFD